VPDGGGVEQPGDVWTASGTGEEGAAGARRGPIVTLVLAIAVLLGIVLLARSGGAPGDEEGSLGAGAPPVATTEDGDADDRAGDATVDDDAAAPGPDDTTGDADEPEDAFAADPVTAEQPTPDPDDPGPSIEAARATLDRYLALADAIYADPGRGVELKGMATGSAADEVEATATEFATVGYRQRGTVAIEEVRADPASLGDDPPLVTLAACLDATEIALVDVDGDTVRAPSPEARSLHLYDLVFTGARWQVVRHDFPDDPSC
jgi:hypothetical protein